MHASADRVHAASFAHVPGTRPPVPSSFSSLLPLVNGTCTGIVGGSARIEPRFGGRRELGRFHLF